MVVLSNNDGCVVSRSNEAKALGIKMGQPWFECKALAEEHGVLALSSNYALYADLSNRVMSVLSNYSPRTEVYSIDECFVDLHGVPGDLTDADLVRELCADVEAVVHCAGAVGNWGRYQDFHQGNVVVTENVVEACLKEHVRRSMDPLQNIM